VNWADGKPGQNRAVGEANRMGNAASPRRILTGYAIWMGTMTALHYAVPGLRTVFAGGIELGGVWAMGLGVYLNRPALRSPWALIAGANLCAAVGDVSGRTLEAVDHTQLRFPSFTDVIYLCTYPLYVGGLALFILYRTHGRDRRSAVDACLLTVGLGLLSWLFLLRPDTMNASMTFAQKFTVAAYPLGDLLILMTLARLLSPGTARGWPIRLITIGTLAALVSDVTYDILQVNHLYHEGNPLNLGWLVCYIAWGAAALHPDMTELTEPVPYRAADSSRIWVLLLLFASMLVPAFQFVWAIDTGDGTEAELAVVTGLLFLLVLSRLWDVVRSNRRGLSRERTLRLAASALASASSVEEVAAAVRFAAAAFHPQVPETRAAILAVREGDRLRPVDPGVQKRPEERGEPVQVWMRLIGGTSSRFASVAEILAARRRAGLTVTDVSGVPATPPAHARLRPGGGGQAGYEGALLCPLNLTDRPTGDPFIGMLAFFGSRRHLANRAPALEILAGQTVLAVERITLSQEVVRQRGEALFRTLVQDASDVILIIDEYSKIRYATPSAADIFGSVPVAGAAITDLVRPDGREDVSRVLDLIFTGLGSGGGAAGIVLRIKRMDGRDVIVEIVSSDLRDDETVGGVVLTLRDVTAQRQLEEELKRRAFNDDLTGLPNRALFVERASEAIAAARRNGRVAGVLFVDLDDFKVVNDTMGHSAGDELLVAVGARLLAAVRKSDTAARFGGDEFALLIDDAPDVDAVEKFAERILAAFEEPIKLAGSAEHPESSVLCLSSVGVATSEDSADADEALRHADLALYAAKAAGKRNYRRYAEALSAGMIRRREVRIALEDALRDSAFTLVYQPMVALHSGEISGFEALLRWPHSKWGMMLPSEFIELAEETGHIVPLGEWVLKQALTHMLGWQRRLGTDAARRHISVNVSARQFRDPGFVAGVRSALRQTGVPPSSLVLELTESLLLDGDDRIREDLADLRNLGLRLAIDDFGTGYSSLAYLLDLPIDILKIDKTFVTGMENSDRQRALVAGIIALANTLGLVTVAEGIETMAERELLAEMDCDYGQGYLLSKPVDANKVEGLLRLGPLVPRLPRQHRKPSARRYLTDL
jgi:diguanylate cyclase (GGDEF)-like protein/PAS domain S-box-containing protein